MCTVYFLNGWSAGIQKWLVKYWPMTSRRDVIKNGIIFGKIYVFYSNDSDYIRRKTILGPNWRDMKWRNLIYTENNFSISKLFVITLSHNIINSTFLLSWFLIRFIHKISMFVLSYEMTDKVKKLLQSGIEPRTFRCLGGRLNHSATDVMLKPEVIWYINHPSGDVLDRRFTPVK